MRLGATESSLWYVTIGLEIVLAVLVLRRRGFHRLPFFTFFVLLSALRSFLLWAVYRWLGFSSLPAIYVAWSSQAIMLVSGGTVCAELCWKILRKRPNLFSAMVRDLLLVVGACLVLYTAFDSVRKSFHIQSSALAIERGLALTIALVFILFSRVAFRYDVRIPRTLFFTGAGLCFHSLVLAVNDTFLDSLNGSFPWWNDFRLVAFHVALSLWIWAFLTRDFDPDGEPAPPVPTFYAERAEEVSRKLRSLERDLEEVVRK